MKLFRYLMLVFVPVAVVARYAGAPPLFVFATSALGMVPLAGWMGIGTEHLAHRTGPRLGGLLNATLGNAAELIITLVALYTGARNPHVRDGLTELVKASITGSILGNVLLVLGFSILCGGLKHGTQKFDRTTAGVNSTMLFLGVIALGIPSLFGHAIDQVDHHGVEKLSTGVAVVMLLIYGLGLAYTLRGGDAGAMADEPAPEELPPGAPWPLRKSIGVLLGATVLIAWLSEILVGAVEPVVHQLGVSAFFLGIVIVPLVGNVAEHIVAVQVAMKNRMELSLAISLGSSLQIALFVAPMLVFGGMLMGNRLTLQFNPFEIAALIGAAVIASAIASDGESHWLEGAQLLAVYVILGMAFYYLPTAA